MRALISKNFFFDAEPNRLKGNEMYPANNHKYEYKSVIWGCVARLLLMWPKKLSFCSKAIDLGKFRPVVSVSSLVLASSFVVNSDFSLFFQQSERKKPVKPRFDAWKAGQKRSKKMIWPRAEKIGKRNKKKAGAFFLTLLFVQEIIAL